MKSFQQLYKEVTSISGFDYADVLEEKAKKIIPVLSTLNGGREGAMAVFSEFILCALASDGRLTKSEYYGLKPTLHLFFGDDFNYDACELAVQNIKETRGMLKIVLDNMVDMYGAVNDALKEDIITVCLIICAVDGKVALKERNWIKKLIA